MEERGRKKREMEGAEEGGARFKRTDRVGMGEAGGFWWRCFYALCEM